MSYMNMIGTNRCLILANQIDAIRNRGSDIEHELKTIEEAPRRSGGRLLYCYMPRFLLDAVAG